MPPRRASKRKKSAPAIATTDVDNHELPPSEVETGAVDVEETETDNLVFNPNSAEIDGDCSTGVVPSSETMIKEESILENCAVGDVNEVRIQDDELDVGSDKVEEDLRNGSENVEKEKQVGAGTKDDDVVCVENYVPADSIDKEKHDLGQGNEIVDEEKQEVEVGKSEDGVVSIYGSQLDTVAEINGAHEEPAACKVGILNANNTSLVVNDDNNEKGEETAQVISVQESNLSKSPSKNNDGLVVEDCNNGDKKCTTEIVSIQEFPEAVITNESCETNTVLALEDDSKENEDNEESDNDDNEGDDIDNVAVEDPSQCVPDNKKDKELEIYVGRLDKNTVEDDLVNVFQQFGELKSTRIVRNSTTKKSKGFAFVKFASVDQANRVLSELKDGVEVKGKRATVSARQDNDTLYLGNICKTWKKDEVLQKLKEYGIGNVETIHLPEDSKTDEKNKGFAFLEFRTHSDAVAAIQQLQRPDVVFGRDISAKVAFSQTHLHPNDNNLSQVKRVYVEGLRKDWNEELVKEMCKKYGEIVEMDLSQSSRTKRKAFGFITFTSHESAIACVEGINSAAIGGDVKIKANIAKVQQKSGLQQKGFPGGLKVEKQSELKKEGEASKGTSKPKSPKMKGGLNSPQPKRNKKDSSKLKVKPTIAKPQQKASLKKQTSAEAKKQSKVPSLKKEGESSKGAQVSKMKGDLNSQLAKRKRKGIAGQNTRAPNEVRHGDQGNLKKPKNGDEGPSSQTTSKAGNRKRKKAIKFEALEDGSNRNTNSKKPFKKQKGNIHGRERDNSRNPRNDSYVRKGHDDYRNSARYIDPYVPKYVTSDRYHPAPDPISTRRYKEMEPHAGYIEPSSANQTRPYSGYVQPVVRTHIPHQTVYLEPASTSQSQLHSRYLEPSVMTQSRRGYIENAVAPEVQPYRSYHQPAILQIARDPYEPAFSRAVRHDARSSGLLTYGGGPPLPASVALPSSQVRDHTSYYQGGSSYSGAYTSQRRYY